jgi:hypothetical protein
VGQFLFISFLLISQVWGTEDPCLYKNLDSLLVSEQSFLSKAPLPKKSDDYKLLYQTAEESFRTNVSIDGLMTTLQKIATGVVKAGASPILVQLKLDRVKAEGVRSAYKLFSSQHGAPKTYGEFVSDFGLLNDALEASDETLAVSRAKLLLKSIKDKNYDTRLLSIKPAKSGSLKTYVQDEMKKIEESMNSKMHIESFHDIRKQIRVFRNLFQTLDAQFPNPAYRDLADEAGKLSDDMGNVKDEFFAAGKTGSEKIKISKDIKARIHGLFIRMGASVL